MRGIGNGLVLLYVPSWQGESEAVEHRQENGVAIAQG